MCREGDFRSGPVIGGKASKVERKVCMCGEISEVDREVVTSFRSGPESVYMCGG